MSAKQRPAERGLDAMIPLLEDASFYPHRPHTVQVIQTHCSLVVVARPYVYKFKKSVDFGFLNYKSLKRRKQFLELECRLNQALAPGVYLGVQAVYWKDGKLSWDGGRVADWVLVMRYLPRRWFLDRRLKQSNIGPTEMDRILQHLSNYYDQEANQSRRKGTLAYLRTAIRNNFHLTQPFAGDLVPKPVHASLKRAAQQGFVRLREVFQKRLQDRWRWCHGDLHLDHVHITSKDIRIYDCIEFADGLRWIDMANDLAFLAMDLDFHGRSDLARYLMGEASIKLRDPDMHRVVGFYKTYRAMVRAKVESLQVPQSKAGDKRAEEKRKRATAYYRLALDYALTGRQATMLVVMGGVGTGKSTLAGQLADCLGVDHLNSDSIRKTLAGVPLHRRPDPATRRRLYTKTMTDRVYRHMMRQGLERIRADQSVVLDATFSNPSMRQRLKKCCQQHRIPLRWVEITASESQVRQRLRARATATQEVSDAGLEEWESLQAQFQSPQELTADEKISIQSGSKIESTLKRLLDALIDLRIKTILQKSTPTKP